MKVQLGKKVSSMIVALIMSSMAFQPIISSVQAVEEAPITSPELKSNGLELISGIAFDGEDGCIVKTLAGKTVTPKAIYWLDENERVLMPWAKAPNANSSKIIGYFEKGKKFEVVVENGQKYEFEGIVETKVSKKSEGLVPIHEIQGKTHVSPLKGKEVSIEGIVTGYYKTSFETGIFVQEADADRDNDPRTSEGILVLGKAIPKLEPGEKVRVKGRVGEKSEKLNNGMYAESLCTTVLNHIGLEKNGKTKELPTPIKISSYNPIPKNVFDSKIAQGAESATRLLDPKHHAMDFYEALEGMRVEIEQPLVVGTAEKYGNIFVVPNKGEGYDRFTPHGTIKAETTYHTGNILTLDFSLYYNKITSTVEKEKVFKKGYDFKPKDEFLENITGIVRYQFGDYKVSYDHNKDLPNRKKSDITRDITSLVAGEDELTIASYNMENFTGKSPEWKVNAVASSIVDNLKCPDIICLVEVQDNDGEGGTSPIADKTYEKLISSIEAAGGAKYDYTQIDPVHGTEGGAPGANIRVGYLYKSEKLKLSQSKLGAGDSVTEAEIVEEHGKWMLKNNPSRLGTTSEAFNDSRKSLVAAFEFKGEDIYIIGNHFKSKRGETGAFGNVQPPAVVPAKRIEQAKLVNAFVEKQILSRDENAKVLILGDINDFEYSEPVKYLIGEKLHNLQMDLPENQRYTYVFAGLAQTLDHVIIPQTMKNKTDFDIVNMNSEFTRQDGRASDHDALIAKIKGFNGTTPEEPKPEEPKGQITLENLTIKNLSHEEVKWVVSNEMVNLWINTKNESALKDVKGTLIFKIENEKQVYRMGMVQQAKSDNGEFSIGFDTGKMPKGQYDVKVYYWKTIDDQQMLANSKIASFTIK